MLVCAKLARVIPIDIPAAKEPIPNAPEGSLTLIGSPFA
jgi:hypothetical protein